MTPVEKYLPPKHLAAELCSAHGLCLSADYLRAIRQESVRLRDGTFVAGCARASAVVALLAVHPTFSRRAARATKK